MATKSKYVDFAQINETTKTNVTNYIETRFEKIELMNSINSQIKAIETQNTSLQNEIESINNSIKFVDDEKQVKNLKTQIEKFETEQNENLEKIEGLKDSKKETASDYNKKLNAFASDIPEDLHLAYIKFIETGKTGSFVLSMVDYLINVCGTPVATNDSYKKISMRILSLLGTKLSSDKFFGETGKNITNVSLVTFKKMFWAIFVDLYSDKMPLAINETIDTSTQQIIENIKETGKDEKTE